MRLSAELRELGAITTAGKWPQADARLLVPLYDVSEMILIFENEGPLVAPLGGKRC
jgi:hypothetical protein